MTDSGLSTRLRQQSRRAGLMVGITMFLAIAICIFGAAALFAWLSVPFSDLIPLSAPAAQVATTQPAENEVESPPTTAPVIESQVEPEEQAASTVAPTTPPFDPTHQISAAQSVNFRSGPSTSDSVIVALSPATPLQFLNEDEPTTNPADGDRWMKFRTEDGQEGWILEILTGPYQP